MIKKLYEEGFLLIENILIKKYKKLNLNREELIVLLFLFDSGHHNVFSSAVLTQKTGFSKNEVEEILESLIKKGFFYLFSEMKGEKMIEVFSLEKTFEKIENLYLEEKQQQNLQKQKNYLAETIDFIEENKGTCLTSYELEVIKSWYQNKKYDHQKIIETIKQAQMLKKISVNYIEKLLNQEDFLKVEQDDRADQILERLFKKIK